jgi:small multidrug resistance pump
MVMAYVYLAIAIISEVVATTALKASDAFTKPLPSAIVVIGYAAAFYCLSLCLRSMQIGIAYAVWAGGGMVLVTISAAIVYREFPDAWGDAGNCDHYRRSVGAELVGRVESTLALRRK